MLLREDDVNNKANAHAFLCISRGGAAIEKDVCAKDKAYPVKAFRLLVQPELGEDMKR